jgi:cytochrome bd-type quinol oxidase subunit 1
MIEGIVSVIIGVTLLLIGLGKARVSKNPEANAAFVKKWGIFFTIAGAISALTGIVMIVSAR